MDKSTIQRYANEVLDLGSWLTENADDLAALDVSIGSTSISLWTDTSSRSVIENDEWRDETDDERRARVISTLGRLSRLMADFDGDGKVDKASGDYSYDLAVSRSQAYPAVRINAHATVEAVCTFEDTDELVEVTKKVYAEPVEVTTLERKRIKHCPPSLLAGIEVPS